MREPKVLVFDIETAPMLAYVWDRKEQYIPTNRIRSDWYVLAWSAKWLGEPANTVIYFDQRNAANIEDDKRILKILWALLDEADIVITQNGKNFDSPKLNARFITHGMQPPSPYRHLDTYQIVRSVAKFTSNSLEYLTDKLCTKYKKLSHKKFPGFSLWTACMNGNKVAWDEMKRYNIHDVLSTEEFYMKIRAWAPASTPKAYASSDSTVKCGTCGEKGHLQRRGIAVTRTGQYARFQCQTCGGWSQGGKIK